MEIQKIFCTFVLFPYQYMLPHLNPYVTMVREILKAVLPLSACQQAEHNENSNILYRFPLKIGFHDLKTFTSEASRQTTYVS